MNVFPTQHDTYTFYYDESNNVRKLYLSKKIDGYNIDHDPDKHNGVNFLLGGVAFKGDSSSADFADLRNRIQLQANASEFKLKHVAKGEFLTMLTSKKLTAFLEWLLQSDLYVHYSNFNMEYWGYLDIIEDCVLFCLEKGIIPNLPDEHLRALMMANKDALYAFVKANKVEFIRILKSFDFPYLEGKEKDFIQALVGQLSTYCVNLYSKEGHDPQQLKASYGLLTLLMACSEQGINDLTLTMDIRTEPPTDEDNLILDGFAKFYQYRAMTFSESKHIFDAEKVVEADLEEVAKTMPEVAALNYTFADSKQDPLIQTSDVMAGLLQRYFDYLNTNSYEDIVKARKSLDDKQRLNMEFLRLIINKSDEHNPMLLFYVVSPLEQEKHKAFCYPDEP